MTKFLFGASLFIAFAFLTALFMVGLLGLQKPTGSTSLVNNTLSSGAGSISSNIQTILNAQEVSKHNNVNDCWMIINNKVYDLTSLVYSHSGGSSTIIPDCGKDGSAGFNGKSHSSTANSILSSFYLGDLGQSIGTSILQNKTSTIASTPIPRSGEDEED